MEDSHDKPRVQTAARTVQLMQEIAKSGASGLSAKELSERLNLPRQVVYHLIHTLTAVKVVRKSSGGGYVLGLGVAQIASGFRRQLSASDSLSRYAYETAKITGETAYVGGWLDGEVVVLASARGSAAIHAAEVPQGATGQGHARASGKLLLAMNPDSDILEYLRRHPLEYVTDKTITDFNDFMRRINDIRETWISFDEEEYTIGLSCISVPIGDPHTHFVLSVSVPTERFLQNRDKYVKSMQELAKKGVD